MIPRLKITNAEDVHSRKSRCETDTTRSVKNTFPPKRKHEDEGEGRSRAGKGWLGSTEQTAPIWGHSSRSKQEAGLPKTDGRPRLSPGVPVLQLRSEGAAGRPRPRAVPGGARVRTGQQEAPEYVCGPGPASHGSDAASDTRGRHTDRVLA